MLAFVVTLGGLAVLAQVATETPTKTARQLEIERTTTLAGKSFEERETTINVERYENYCYKYRLQPPEKVEPGKTYPLVVFLHGAGERGIDNRAQLRFFPEYMAAPEQRRKYPCYIFAPQCRGDEMWVYAAWNVKKSDKLPEKPSPLLEAATTIMDGLVAELPIDKQRIYLTGLSMGGFGSWDLAMRRPDYFAAVAPICGGGDETQAAKIKHLLIWAFHGDADSLISVELTRNMIAALKAAGGSPKYTEYPGVGHDCWNAAYHDPNGLVPWMFEQRKQ